MSKVVHGLYGSRGEPKALAKKKWHGLSMEEKNNYVEKYASLIKYLADRLASRLPEHINKDDLISCGILGLIDAVDKFDPEREIKFKTYAEFRIRGAMIDELRNLDWVPRSIRKKSSQLEKIYRELELKLKRPADDEEVAQALGISVEEYLKLLDEVKTVSILELDAFSSFNKSGSSSQSRDLYEIVPDESALDALAMLGRHEVKEILAQAIDSLGEKERLVLSLYYHEELTMKEIGKVLGYTESRISQLHTKGILKMRFKLRDYFKNDKS